jgi:hypothetical protein
MSACVFKARHLVHASWPGCWRRARPRRPSPLLIFGGAHWRRDGSSCGPSTTARARLVARLLELRASSMAKGLDRLMEDGGLPRAQLPVPRHPCPRAWKRLRTVSCRFLICFFHFLVVLFCALWFLIKISFVPYGCKQLLGKKLLD